jgi:GDP-L-fucose synthase
MNKSSKIFIAGASGMVGSAIVRNLAKNGYTNLMGSFHSRRLKELDDLPITMIPVDLTHQEDVSR